MYVCQRVERWFALDFLKSCFCVVLNFVKVCRNGIVCVGEEYKVLCNSVCVGELGINKICR